MPRALIPQDVFAFRSVADARIAPDASRILATLTRRDIATDERVPSLILSTDRANWTGLADTEGAILARFAPDSRRIALLRRAGGGFSLALHADGEVRTLHRSATPLRELAWSPDGGLIAFQQRVDTQVPDWLGLPTPPEGASWAPPPKHTARLVYRHDAMGELPESVFHVFVVPADGSAPARRLTDGSWHNGFPHHVPPGLIFSADGSELLIAGTQAPDWDAAPSEIDIHAIRLADGAVRRLTDIAGPTAHPAPSPDGRLIAFTAVRQRGLSHQLRRLHVMPADGSAPPREVLPEFDRSIGDIAWTADSRALIVAYDDAGAHHIARVELDGRLTDLAYDAGSGAIEMPYSGGGFSVARDGSIAYVATAIDRPSDVAIITPNRDTGILTAFNQDLAAEVGGFQGAEAFWIDGPEGRTIQCWLMRPQGEGPHPLVLEIHGGPYAQYGARFSIKYQMLAAAGYAVLFTNPTGSTGYGEEFANALHDRFPGPDYADLMAAVDAAIARPGIDADRLFITGVSGGGVLTLWTVTHTHRFRAAVAIKPVVDWQSWLLTADIGASIGRTWMGNTLPWEAPEKFRARSPLAHAQHARTPTLLMAGEADSRTPLSEAQQMYAALRLAGVEAHLLRFPGTSHSSTAMRPSLFAAEVAATIGWFDKYRK
jgi:dipeptidyl aminopeptidase/acylaminoacyl peptidase